MNQKKEEDDREPVPAPLYKENGRLYHGGFAGSYLIPCDKPERDRLDYYEFTIRKARESIEISGPREKGQIPELHLHRFFWPEKQPRVLDLGTGRGGWAVEMAKRYRRIKVVGVDLVKMQLEDKPLNCSFQIADFEVQVPWTTPADYWDYIRLGSLLGSIMDWNQLYLRTYNHLKPGPYCLEQEDIDLRPRCDDGSLPDDPEFSLNKWYRLLTEAYRASGRSIEYNEKTPQILESLGFVEVHDHVIQLPLAYRPDWPPQNEPRKREIAQLYHFNLLGDPTTRDPGFEALSLAAFTRVHGWSYEDWREFDKQIAWDLEHSGAHIYHNL